MFRTGLEHGIKYVLRRFCQQYYKQLFYLQLNQCPRHPNVPFRKLPIPLPSPDPSPLPIFELMASIFKQFRQNCLIQFVLPSILFTQVTSVTLVIEYCCIKIVYGKSTKFFWKIYTF